MSEEPWSCYSFCMLRPPRVAFFPDSFHEVNGVAHTSRKFVDYARRHDFPLLCVRGSVTKGRNYQRTGSVEEFDLGRTPVAIGLEHDLKYDLLFWRHARAVEATLRRFRPDIIHITGPSEFGLLGASLANRLRIPMVAAWQTNLHEYVPMRLARVTRFLPFDYAAAVDRRLEHWCLQALFRLYRKARIILAPSPDLCTWLTADLGIPCHLMNRGIDTDLFSPLRRTRQNDGTFRLGYVGRLSLEKNVGVLPGIAKQLQKLGLHHIRFVVVGQGAEEAYLRSDLPQAEFTGVLRGAALAEAYANMDLLVFPSHTDTFGNVVLEALGSGVPAVVTSTGGPKHIVRDGQTGLVVPSQHEPASRAEATLFAHTIAELVRNPERLRQMGEAARHYALTCTWDSIFDGVYGAYERILPRTSTAPDLSPQVRFTVPPETFSPQNKAQSVTGNWTNVKSPQP